MIIAGTLGRSNHALSSLSRSVSLGSLPSSVPQGTAIFSCLPLLEVLAYVPSTGRSHRPFVNPIEASSAALPPLVGRPGSADTRDVCTIFRRDDKAKIMQTCTICE